MSPACVSTVAKRARLPAHTPANLLQAYGSGYVKSAGMDTAFEIDLNTFEVSLKVFAISGQTCWHGSSLVHVAAA